MAEGFGYLAMIAYRAATGNLSMQITKEKKKMEVNSIPAEAVLGLGLTTFDQLQDGVDAFWE